MQAVLPNVDAIMAAVAAGEFCDPSDPEHRFCPLPRPDGGVQFPTASLHPDGAFRGSRRLYERLAAIPEDYRPVPRADICKRLLSLARRKR